MLRCATKSPVIIDPAEHPITPEHIDRNAINVLYSLEKAGYDAYLVGGCVRDLLLGSRPKDFDIVTDAHPEQIRKLFRNSRLIGRRFRLVHVHFGREYIEVATYRADHEKANGRQQGLLRGDRIIRDNVYGNQTEDAVRRDFTINALYFNYRRETITDHVQGLVDLERKQLRLIGDPEQRYREDPVRLLRAVRFAARLDFSIEAGSLAPLLTLGGLLETVHASRLFEETLKLLLMGCGERSFHLLKRYRLWDALFPGLSGSDTHQEMIVKGLADTDRRVAEGKAVTPAYLFAVLLWEDFRQKMGDALLHGTADYEEVYRIATEVFSSGASLVVLPRRFSQQILDIWVMQFRLRDRMGKQKALRLLESPRFRAAYDFLLLRQAAGEPIQQQAAWWKDLVESESRQLTGETEAQVRKKPNRRRRRPRAEPALVD